MSQGDGLFGRVREAWPTHKKRVLGALLASLTLGFAPFYPHAHVWKQLVNLAQGTLTAPLDQFDLLLHGAPWVALFAATGWLLVDAARGSGGATVRNPRRIG